MYFQNIDLYISQNLLKTRAQKYMFWHVLQQRLFLLKKFTKAVIDKKKFWTSLPTVLSIKEILMYRDFLKLVLYRKKMLFDITCISK